MHKLKHKRMYNVVYVPQEAIQDPAERFESAYLNNTFSYWVVPASWRVVWDRGDYVKLCRIQWL